MNGGTCVASTSTTATCKCKPNYTGFLCETSFRKEAQLKNSTESDIGGVVGGGGGI